MSSLPRSVLQGEVVCSQVDKRLRLTEENRRLHKECDLVRSDIDRLRVGQQHLSQPTTGQRRGNSHFACECVLLFLVTFLQHPVYLVSDGTLYQVRDVDHQTSRER